MKQPEGVMGPVPRHGPVHEWLARLMGQRAQVDHEPSSDPVLAAFAEPFADSGLAGLTATEQLRVEALTRLYDCWTQSLREGDAAPTLFSVAWTPNRQGRDSLVGFRSGEDSLLIGTAPTVAMPQDERTAALLLVVTSAFVHPSAQQSVPSPVISGIVDADGGYRFLTLPTETG